MGEPNITISVQLPKLRLSYSRKRLQAAAGRRVARVVKKMLRSGKETDGDALPQPLDKGGKAPLRRSGRLINSVTYHKGVVVPNPRRRPKGEKSTVNMSGLLGVLIYGRKNWRSRNRKDNVRMNPLEETEGLRRLAARAAQAEINRQVRRGIAKIEDANK